MRLRDILSLAAHNLRESPLRTAGRNDPVAGGGCAGGALSVRGGLFRRPVVRGP